MAATKTKNDNRGRRVGLTRERVVAAAVELIDAEGLETFSLRRLAAVLGVDPMSLYNHVANKEDLLDGVVEVVMGEIAATGPLTGSWDDQIRQSAAAFRSVLLAHPQVSVVVLTRRVLTEMPLEVLRAAVNPLLAAGLRPRDAVVVLRTFTAFLTGAILRELGSAMSFATVDLEVTRARVAELTGSGDLVLAAAAEEIATIDHRAVFDRGVELFIAGLAAELGGAGGD